MAQTTTHETYKTACKRRSKVAPLHQGKYKLAEARNTLHRVVATIERTLGEPTKLRPFCMPDEAGRWAKTVPTLIADTLGGTLMPAVKALEGDGLDRKHVDALAAECQTIVDTLLADAEAVRGSLPQGGLPPHLLQELLTVATKAASAVDTIASAVEQVPKWD